LFEHDLFGKPLHTFPDHALAANSSRGFVNEKTGALLKTTRPIVAVL
jgi:hypothetical protein